MSTLLPSERLHLAKLLGMLGSNHAGERDAAGLAAHRLVQKRGITWFDVVVQPPLPETDPYTDPDTDPIGVSWRRTAAACSRYPHLLSRWEADFLAGLLRFPNLSCKQRSALLKIVVRLRACRCAI
jgi:hypothetical protein